MRCHLRDRTDPLSREPRCFARHREAHRAEARYGGRGFIQVHRGDEEMEKGKMREEGPSCKKTKDRCMMEKVAAASFL